MARLNFKTTEKNLRFEFEVSYLLCRNMASLNLLELLEMLKECHVDMASLSSIVEKISLQRISQQTIAKSMDTKS